MENKTKKIFQFAQGRKPQIHDVVFGMEYFLNLKLMISCGFSTTLGFKPILWLHYKDKQFIGLDREEWLHLMSYKEYITNIINQYKFIDLISLIETDSDRDVYYSFKYKNGICYLILKQGKYEIKIDPETWRSLSRIGSFLTTLLCWNTILRKQIAHFYYDFYIPTCSTLNKTNIQFCEINTVYEKDIEIDLTRLCYEISKKMQNKIKTDVKIHRLLLRCDNKEEKKLY